MDSILASLAVQTVQLMSKAALQQALQHYLKKPSSETTPLSVEESDAQLESMRLEWRRNQLQAFLELTSRLAPLPPVLASQVESLRFAILREVSQDSEDVQKLADAVQQMKLANEDDDTRNPPPPSRDSNRLAFLIEAVQQLMPFLSFYSQPSSMEPASSSSAEVPLNSLHSSSLNLDLPLLLSASFHLRRLGDQSSHLRFNEHVQVYTLVYASERRRSSLHQSHQYESSAPNWQFQERFPLAWLEFARIGSSDDSFEYALNVSRDMNDGRYHNSSSETEDNADDNDQSSGQRQKHQTISIPLRSIDRLFYSTRERMKVASSSVDERTDSKDFGNEPCLVIKYRVGGNGSDGESQAQTRIEYLAIVRSSLVTEDDVDGGSESSSLSLTSDEEQDEDDSNTKAKGKGKQSLPSSRKKSLKIDKSRSSDTSNSQRRSSSRLKGKGKDKKKPPRSNPRTSSSATDDNRQVNTALDLELLELMIQLGSLELHEGRSHWELSNDQLQLWLRTQRQQPSRQSAPLQQRRNSNESTLSYNNTPTKSGTAGKSVMTASPRPGGSVTHSPLLQQHRPQLQERLRRRSEHHRELWTSSLANNSPGLNATASAANVSTGADTRSPMNPRGHSSSPVTHVKKSTGDRSSSSKTTEESVTTMTRMESPLMAAASVGVQWRETRGASVSGSPVVVSKKSSRKQDKINQDDSDE